MGKLYRLLKRGSMSEIDNFEVGQKIDGKDLPPWVFGEPLSKTLAEREGNWKGAQVIVTEVDLKNKSITVKAVE
jgi:CTP:molybdopterin cytidylyltransferase MocA